jgi:putative endonuclease
MVKHSRLRRLIRRSAPKFAEARRRRTKKHEDEQSKSFQTDYFVSKSNLMHYVYILRSLKNPRETYKGYTSTTPPDRLERHNSGLSIYTSQDRPWKIIWYCAFEDIKKAKEFEKYLKSGSGRAFANRHLVAFSNGQD